MASRADLEPIVHVYQLPCSVEAAFETYASRIGEWWHPDYTASATAFRGVTIEPGVGGRIVAHYSDRPDEDWGTLITREPPHRLSHTFTLGQSASAPSEVTVTFAPTDGGCQMRFAHGGWSAENAEYRPKFTEWPRILDRFAALVA